MARRGTGGQQVHLVAEVAPRALLSALDVILVESQEVVRRGLEQMLLSLRLVASVSLAASPQDAKDILSEQTVDLLLVSAEVTETDLEALLISASPDTRVLLLIETADASSLTHAATLPAHGYLMREELTSKTLDDALKRIARGEVPMPAALAQHLLVAARRHRMLDPGSLLTPREQQVLELIAEGLSNKQVATRLGISDHGAKRHVGNLLAKLHCPNRTLAVVRAIEWALLPPPEAISGPETPAGL